LRSSKAAFAEYGKTHVVQIRKQFAFEAAHVLPHHAGKCSRLHGHSYRLEVTIAGALQSAGPASGMVMDFDDLSRIVRTNVIEPLDHRLLNDVLDNPTSERIVLWIWQQLAHELPAIAELALWETATSGALLRRGDPELA
jgi:6-pyruvoyltetrahydropterin/6-carboxytetrahydropterin synthase